jgi:hypothetical protein
MPSMKVTRPGTLRALLLSAGLAAFFYGALSCSNSPGTLGQTCSTFATDQTCATDLTCQCITAGCFCVGGCDPTLGLTSADGGVIDAGTSSDGGVACASGYSCIAGVRPAEGATGYFCFPAGAAADGGT